MDRALVGRGREMEALAEALRGAAGGKRAVLMVSGEPGIGKTRLLEELATSVVASGGTAAWGRMWEVGLTPSFWPWIQILATLETPEDRAPALGGLEGHAAAAARLALFGEVRAFLNRRAATATVALLLDDLHAADPSSLQLLEYLLPVVGARVLIALAARDADAPREVAAALGRIQRGARRLALSRLGAADVQALVGGRADAARVFELSEGNPLFVEELLASHSSTGSLALPRLSSVRVVIRERVTRLPEPTQAALAAAAVVGRDFHGRVVSHMVGAADAAALLEPALELGMVSVTGPDRFRFSHALIAEAITDELRSPERARLHLSAAQAIERLDPGDTSALAHHLLAAGHLAADAAVRAAERAAKDCVARLAFEDAAALLERALAALQLAAPEDARRCATLLCARAEALQHAAQHAAAAELCDQAAAIVRSLGVAAQDDGGAPSPDAELFARIALTRGLEFRFGRTDPLLVTVLREALDRLGDGPLSLRAKLLARLAAAEQPARDPQGPVERAFEAIELAKDLGPRDRLDVTYVAAAALVEYVEPERMERIHREVLELARGRDRWISVHTRHRLCFVALERIDRGAFEVAVAEFSAEATALGLPQWGRYVHMLAALTALLEGRFEEAERAAARCEALSTALGDVGAAFTLDVHRALSSWTRTAPVDPGKKERLLEYTPGRAAIAAWLGAQEGDLEATRAALGELDGKVSGDPEMASMVGTAVAFAGDRELASKFYEALVPRRNRIVLMTMVGSAVMDLYDRVLLELAARAERWDDVEPHGDAALAIAERLGSPVWQARTQASFADALERRGRPGDAERARGLRAAALETASRLSMPGLERQCRARIDASSRGVSGSIARAAASGTSAVAVAVSAPAGAIVRFVRQGELWIVSGFGETVHVKDSRGMKMLARLVDEPGSPLHALDLAGGGGEADGGDAGPALDAKARAEYRARLSELVADRDEAEARCDRGRVERASAEIELLTAELERAFGLGGRERRVGAASERARTNVQRRIAHGLEQIRAASRRLGEHLAATIRTGTYCVYEPGGPGPR